MVAMLVMPCGHGAHGNRLGSDTRDVGVRLHNRFKALCGVMLTASKCGKLCEWVINYLTLYDLWDGYSLGCPEPELANQEVRLSGISGPRTWRRLDSEFKGEGTSR